MLDSLSYRDGPVSTPDRGETSTEQLMEWYKAGDGACFEQLYARTSPKLFGYLMRLTRDRARSEDLLQVTFQKLHRARASYLSGAPLLPWVLAIARRAFLDEQRALGRRREYLSEDGRVPEPADEPRELASDLGVALDRALNELPESYREAIQLTKITGLSIAEAALVLGTTPTAVKLRVHRGYARLRVQLDVYRRGTQ